MEGKSVTAGESEEVVTVVEASTDEARLPYEAPQIDSGPAFEQVLLLSGCNFGIFGCPIPC